MIVFLSKIVSVVSFLVCHQLPERSLRYFGKPPCFCARCMGIYSGFFIMLVYFFGYRVLYKKEKIRGQFSTSFLIFALAIMMLMGVDVLLQGIGIYFSNITRVASGLLFSYGLSILVMYLFSDSSENVPILRVQERVFLGVLMSMVFGLALLQNEYVLLGIHVVAACGFLIVFSIANIAILRFIFQKKWGRVRELSFAALLLVLESVVLFLFHASFSKFLW